MIISKTSCRIYVISLASDIARRQKFRNRFHLGLPGITFVDGIDIKKPEVLMVSIPSCRANRHRPLVPAEQGCALSHLKIYDQFLTDPGVKWALILEDDIVGTSEDLDDIQNVLELLPDDTFLLCGGQEGKNGARYLYGRETHIPGVHRIPHLLWRFMSGGCCYALSKHVARSLKDMQHACLDRADNWHRLIPKKANVYYMPKLAHTLDMSTSHIEAERNSILGTRSSLKRIWRDGVLHVLSNNIIKILILCFGRAFGLKRVCPRKNYS